MLFNVACANGEIDVEIEADGFNVYDREVRFTKTSKDISRTVGIFFDINYVIELEPPMPSLEVVSSDLDEVLIAST